VLGVPLITVPDSTAGLNAEGKISNQGTQGIRQSFGKAIIMIVASTQVNYEGLAASQFNSRITLSSDFSVCIRVNV
jgi:hypothetical protein